jgi:hypothetical protein
MSIKSTKVKAELSLCLTMVSYIRIYDGNGGMASRILNFRTKWMDSFSRLPLCTRESASGTCYTGGCMATKLGQDGVEKRKIPLIETRFANFLGCFLL